MKTYKDVDPNVDIFALRLRRGDAEGEVTRALTNLRAVLNGLETELRDHCVDDTNYTNVSLRCSELQYRMARLLETVKVEEATWREIFIKVDLPVTPNLDDAKEISER